MNLKDFRDTHPFQPYTICLHRDGRHLEAISWPYCDEGQEETGPVFIKAREPHEPTTMQTYRIDGDDPDLRPVTVTCPRDNTTFTPTLDNRFPGSLTCPTCGRGYIQTRGGNWMSDRPLTFNQIN